LTAFESQEYDALMAYVQAPFVPDYPGALVVPAHEDNIIDAFNNPRGLVLHTPEEEADDTEVTPFYFSHRIYDAKGNQRRASTHFYHDSDGDVYQMVPVNIGAIANGLDGMPAPPWAILHISLNLQTESTEIEGYAAGMNRTCPRGSRQWNSVVRWTEARSWVNGFPLLRERVLGHYQLSNQRSDPGTLDINGIVSDAQALREIRLMAPEIDLIKLFAEWEGSCLEMAGLVSRRQKFPKGLIDRIQAILNLAKS